MLFFEEVPELPKADPRALRTLPGKALLAYLAAPSPTLPTIWPATWPPASPTLLPTMPPTAAPTLEPTAVPAVPAMTLPTPGATVPTTAPSAPAAAPPAEAPKEVPTTPPATLPSAAPTPAVRLEMPWLEESLIDGDSRCACRCAEDRLIFIPVLYLPLHALALPHSHSHTRTSAEFVTLLRQRHAYGFNALIHAFSD